MDHPNYNIDVEKAVEILRTQQCHPQLSEFQINVVKALANNQNSLNQLPTGSGKTWPVVCFPQILDILRDELKYDLPTETRVLYVIPLVNIYQSVSVEMDKLNIPHQIMHAGGDTDINPSVKVVCISPERLLNKVMMKSILNHKWSCISIDEPHLALGKPSKNQRS